jgi:inner membrane protein
MAMLGHLAIGVAAGRTYSDRADSRLRLGATMLLGVVLAALPDLDLIGPYFLGVPYFSVWGHRGFAHSLFAAIVVGMLVGLISARYDLPALRTGLFACAVVASHGLVDTLTNTPNGCALLWPLSDARFIAPIRPVLRAPLGLAYFGEVGMRALLREVLLFWPLLLYAAYPRGRLGAR